MERGRSFMKKWSKVKKMLEDDCLCETLKGRVKSFNTRYRSAHDRAGRICILVDKKEILNMPSLKEYELYDLAHELSSSDQSLKEAYENADEIVCSKGICAPWNFEEAFEIYQNQKIGDSIRSDYLLVKLLAILDRRVGKRSLASLEGELAELPKWLQYFYQLRLESCKMPQRGA